jgi:hypothetical protein
VNKNAEQNSSAKCDGNKQIADFIFAKERSDFRKESAAVRKIAKAGEFYGRTDKRRTRQA